MAAPVLNKLTVMQKSIFLSVLLAMAACGLHAQKKSPENTLLWRISGKNLPKPSYLYGTIHVQDKRVFNFSDSLYSFIQAADGFAMEIHPDSIAAALLQKMSEDVSSEYVKKYLKKSEYDELNAKLKKEFGVDADKLTIRETYLLRQHLAKPERKPDDMPTIVDAYLYGLAKNQGKEIAGLEKAADHFNIVNNLSPSDVDVKKLLKSLKKDQSFIDKLIQLYIKEDLRGISQMMSYLPDQTEDKLLNLRNELMVQRMESLIQSKSFVVAVGTAHLPGEKGIIELMRRKGYTVEPVFTTSRTHANKYSIKAQERNEWVKVDEPSLGYTARMPGKPSPMEMLDGLMKMNVYVDLTSMKQYYTAFVLPGVAVTNRNADSLLQSMHKNMISSSGAVPLSDKRFTRGEFEAMEMLYQIPAENIHARVQTFAFGKRVYIVGMGAREKDDLYRTEATDFFNAFTIGKMEEQQWQQHTFNDHFFSISLPGTPKGESVEGSDSSVHATQYSSLDTRDGSFYGVVIVTTAPGFVIPDDSAYFASAAERFMATLNMQNMRQSDTVFQGFKANWITGSLKQGGMMKCLAINRGNRLYTLMMTSNQEDGNTPGAPVFFNSFNFIEYPPVRWKTKPFPEQGFTATVASEYSRIDFLDDAEDSVKPAAQRSYTWVGYDSASATTFTITRNNVTPYLWARDDSIVLKKYMELYQQNGGKFGGLRSFRYRLFRIVNATNESLPEYRYIKNGKVNGIEFVLNKPNSSHTEYVRIFLNGKAKYTLQVNVPREYWTKYDFQQFLQGFKFDQEEKTDYLRSNSLQTLLSGLRSTDSATFSAAYDAIDEVIYDSSDISTLISEGMAEYPLDTLEYRPARDKLLDVILSMKHPGMEEMVVKTYYSLKPEKEKLKYSLLALLSQTHTAKSYALIDELLAKGSPTAGDPDEFIYGLDDSLALTKNLYPRLLTFTADTITGTSLFSLHQRMIDSGMVSIGDIRQYESVILQAGRNALDKMSRSTAKFYFESGLNDLLGILAKLPSSEARRILREFIKSKHIHIKYNAAVQLLRIKQPVDPPILLSIAADSDYRISLYDEMKKLGIEAQYPPKYLNQKAFAESYLISSLEDGYERLDFIGEKTVLYKGKRQKFYLYKVAVAYYGEEANTYLGVSGPFDLDGKNILISKERIAGVYQAEEFKQSAIDKHFRLYLLQFEDEDEEVKDDEARIGTLDEGHD